MRDKHQHHEADSKLLKQLYSRVAKELAVKTVSTRKLLIGKFVFYFSLLMISYASIFLGESVTILVFSYVTYGIFCVLMGFNFAHDLCHNTIFQNKRLNNTGYTFIYTLLGAHAEAWKKRHIHSHHYAPNVKDYDTDLQITSMIRVEPNSELKWFHRFQHIYAPIAYTGYSLYWVFIKDVVIYVKDAGGMSLKYHLSFLFQKIFYLGYILVLPMLFSVHSADDVIIAFLVMHLVQSLFLLFTFFITHHVESTAYFITDDKGYINTSWLNNQVRSSNDFYPFSRLANFVFGGFNNHIAHHLFPHIIHVHYPALNRILYSLLQQNGITPNKTGYVEGIFSHLRYLKHMGKTQARVELIPCSP